MFSGKTPPFQCIQWLKICRARSHPLARPSGSRFARMPPPIRFAHLRCIFSHLALMVKLCLTKICPVPKAQAFGKPLTAPKPSKLSKPALPVSVPFKREASERVSGSDLLGSELKFLHALHGQTKASTPRHFFVPLFMKNGTNHHQPQ